MNNQTPIQKLSCWYYHRRLLPYLEGSLPRWERPLVSRHVSACPGCRQDLKSFQQLTNSLRDAAPAPAPPASDLWQRLESRLQTPPQAPTRRFTAPRVYPLTLSSLSLAAIALLLTFDAGYAPWGHAPVKMAAPDGSASAPAVRAVRIAANPPHPMANATAESAADGLLTKPGTSLAVVPAHALVPGHEIRPHVAAGAPDVQPAAVSQRELRRPGRVPEIRESPGPREMIRVKRTARREHTGPRFGAGDAAARLSKRAPGPITDNINPVRLAMAAPTLAPAVFSAPGASDLRLKMANGVDAAAPGTPAPKMMVTAATSGIVGSVMLAGDRVREMDSHPDPATESTPPTERVIQNIPPVGGAVSAVPALQATAAANVSTNSTAGASYYCQVQTLDARGEPESTSRLWGEGGPTGPLVFVQSNGVSTR